MNSNFNLGAAELLLLLIPLVVLFLGVAPYVTWRRGGSKRRIIVALTVSLVPYVGWIAAMIVALTTKRSGKAVRSGIASDQVPMSVAVVPRRGETASTFRRIAVAGVLLSVAVLTGIAGYYLGRQDRQSPPRQAEQSPRPTWIDREIRAAGTQNVGTLRCTYHMADGSVRVSESVIALATTDPYDPFNPYSRTPNPVGARTPDCPPSP